MEPSGWLTYFSIAAAVKSTGSPALGGLPGSMYSTDLAGGVLISFLIWLAAANPVRRRTTQVTKWLRLIVLGPNCRKIGSIDLG